MEKRTPRRGDITLGEAHGLEVAVTTACGETFAGKLLNLTMEDAAASFPRDAGPALPVGPLTTLILTSSWLHTPIRVNASVTSRVENGALRNYRYRFKFDSEEVKERVSREVERMRNQRTANRVKPPPAERVAIKLRLPARESSESFETTGYLKDISTGGVGVLVNSRTESVFAATDLIEISFQLPPSSKTVQLTGWIRHRQLQGRRVSYGLEFDTERSENFALQLDEIAKYIALCKRQ